jgi:hypothetical protein
MIIVACKWRPGATLPAEIGLEEAALGENRPMP